MYPLEKEFFVGGPLFRTTKKWTPFKKTFLKVFKGFHLLVDEKVESLFEKIFFEGGPLLRDFSGLHNLLGLVVKNEELKNICIPVAVD